MAAINEDAGYRYVRQQLASNTTWQPASENKVWSAIRATTAPGTCATRIPAQPAEPAGSEVLKHVARGGARCPLDTVDPQGVVMGTLNCRREKANRSDDPVVGHE